MTVGGRAVSLLAALLCFGIPTFGQAKPTTPKCLPFTVIWVDQLGNVTAGFSKKVDADENWFQQLIAKKYPGAVCYVGSEAIPQRLPQGFLVLKIWETPNDRTVITGGVARRNRFSRTFTATLLEATGELNKDGHDNFATRHSFKEDDCPACHPQHAIIEHTLKWLHEGGLTDKMQGVESH